jgi:hypothetical protein
MKHRARALQTSHIMREPDRHQRPSRDSRKPGADEERERRAVIERSEAHRRWIGDDGDGACRGID